MRVFYETCFTLQSVEVAEDFCVLASADWHLSLVLMPAPVAAGVVVADPPKRRESTPIKLAFQVVALDAALAEVAACGGRSAQGEAVREFAGHRLLDCVDPEGNVVQLRERIRQHR